MKIAFLIEGRYPIYGWWQIYAEYLTRWLVDEKNCTVDIFTRKIIESNGNIYDNNEELKSWLHLIRSGYAASFFNFFSRLYWLCSVTLSLYRRTRTEKYDLISAQALLPGLPAKIVSILTWVPVVYTVHGTMHLDQWKKWLFYWLEYFLVCTLRYRWLISVSHRIEQYHVRTKQKTVIRNGVDLQKTAAIQAESKYPYRTFIFVGRFDRQKNVVELIEIIHRIGKDTFTKHHAKIHMIGNGILYEEVCKKIEEYWLQDIVILLGIKTHTEVIREMKKSHVFLLPSKWEGQPLTLLEAMACGLSLICTDVGDNKRIIDPSLGSVATDSASLETILLHYLSLTDEAITQLWVHSFQKAQDFDREHVIEKTYLFYKKMLK